MDNFQDRFDPADELPIDDGCHYCGSVSCRGCNPEPPRGDDMNDMREGDDPVYALDDFILLARMCLKDFKCYCVANSQCAHCKAKDIMTSLGLA